MRDTLPLSMPRTPVFVMKSVLRTGAVVERNAGLGEFTAQRGKEGLREFLQPERDFARLTDPLVQREGQDIRQFHQVFVRKMFLDD